MREQIYRSKKGLPCLIEQGGSCRNTGDAMVIAGRSGERKRAIYVYKHGHLSNSYHAIIPINVGDWVIKVARHRENYEIFVYSVSCIDVQEAELTLFYEFSTGEWNKPVPEYLDEAVDTAVKKAFTYHCREAMYIA